MSARLGDLVAIEAQKLARQLAPRILAAILLAYGLLVVASLALVLRAPAAQGLDTEALLQPLRQGAPLFLGTVFAGIATLLGVVLACESMGQEFARGTLRTLVLAGARRAHVPLAKLVLLAALAVAVALTVAALSLLATWALSAASGEDLLRLSAADAGRLALLAFVPFLAWGTLALAATLLLRSLGGGLATGLSLLVAGDLLAGLLASLGSWGAWLARALPNTAISALASGRMEAADWLWVAPNLALYLGGLLAWGLLRLRRTDLLAATR